MPPPGTTAQGPAAELTPPRQLSSSKRPAAAAKRAREGAEDDESNESDADVGLAIALSLSMAHGEWASTPAKRQATTAAGEPDGSSSGLGIAHEEHGYYSSDDEVLLVHTWSPHAPQPAFTLPPLYTYLYECEGSGSCLGLPCRFVGAA